MVLLRLLEWAVHSLWRRGLQSLREYVAVHLEGGHEGRASSEEPALAVLCKGPLGIASLALARLEDHLASGLTPA